MVGAGAQKVHRETGHVTRARRSRGTRLRLRLRLRRLQRVVLLLVVLLLRVRLRVRLRLLLRAQHALFVALPQIAEHAGRRRLRARSTGISARAVACCNAVAAPHRDGARRHRGGAARAAGRRGAEQKQ